ncbi:hypothetical protein JTB14_000712 [Gonioctena quinquepunctata]|nr:hypothetical protein JTB14_000712 [Gonioctena quinquepunctata]
MSPKSKKAKNESVCSNDSVMENLEGQSSINVYNEQILESLAETLNETMEKNYPIFQENCKPVLRNETFSEQGGSFRASAENKMSSVFTTELYIGLEGFG